MAVLAMCLAAPAIAHAANTATFSSASPAAGTYVMTGAPKLSVTVYDRYGVKGSSNYALYVDGVKVKPTISYVAGYGYKKFKLTYQVVGPLAAGASHSVRVWVKDLQLKTSSKTWSFLVDSPDPAATFSALAPASGADLLDTRPTVSVRIVDRWDVAASGVSLSIDGSVVPGTVSYQTPGSLRSLLVSYRPVAPLGPGAHTVAISVTDAAARTTSTSWSFDVFPEMPSIGAACGDCHVGYPAAHPMTSCAACHGDAAPARPASGLYGSGTMTSYTPADTSAHTLSCALESPCHGGASLFPHVLDSDCARCHTGSFAGIPVAHSLDVPSLHVSTAAFCARTGCHFGSLTVEHYRYTADGARLSCATCHANDRTEVAAAIEAGDTACTSCHSFPGAPHVGTLAAHAKPTLACTESGCHAADLSSIHGGNCARCHAPGVVASSNCTSCHPTQPHTGLDGLHTAPAMSCTADACHGSNAITPHLARGPLACQSCHAPGVVRSLDCTSCHGSDVAVVHDDGAVPHAVSGDCAIAGCHVRDAADAGNVTAIHADGPGCAACHAPSKVPSNVCSACHSAGTFHAPAAAAHAWSYKGANCAVAGCHSDDVSLVHKERGIGCAACHAPGVTPSTACSTCHTNVGHTDLAATHTAPTGACFNSFCHVSSVLSIHEGNCAACHAPGKVPSTKCLTCHVDAHAGQAAAHVPTDSCATTGCHSAPSVATLHDDSCARCHFQDYEPSKTCADCHQPHVDLPAHQVTVGCVSCHGGDVSIIHTTGAGAPGCVACHQPGRALTTDCGTEGCHPAPHDIEGAHAASPLPADIAINGASYGTFACSECHTPLDLRYLHDSDCALCHGTPVSGTLGGDWQKGCAQGDCHTATSARPLHGTIDAAHTLASPPACVGAGCHVGGSDVAAIHSPALGCATCHGAGKTPTLVCASVGCHAGGAGGAHDSHPSPDTAADITINGVVYAGRACLDCHTSLELQAVHGGSDSCATCHPSPANTAADGSFACAQGDCHAGTSPIPMHGGVDGAHTLATQPLCTASGCHSGGSDVAAIHAPALGCATCHGGGKTPTLDCGNAACHPDGPPISHDGHPVTVTSGSVRILGVDYPDVQCGSCHVPLELQSLHGGITSCSTCHPSPRDSFVAWDGGCVQGGCHTPTSTLPIHTGIDALHTAAPADALACGGADCHGTIGSVAALHAAGPGCVACHNSTVTASVSCASCHGTHDLPGIHAATPPAEIITINTVGYGSHDCAECHTSLDLRALHESGCFTCHPLDRDVLGGDWNKTCVQGGCHTAGSTAPMHAEVSTAHTLSSPPACAGAGCHVGGSDVAAIHAPALGCATCHGAGKTPTLVCASDGCHASGAGGAHDSHPSPDTAADIIINGVVYAARACIDCHTSLDLQAVHGGATSCGTCHPSPANTAADGSFACAQGDCHAGASPLPMHGDADGAHTLAAQPTCTADGCHDGGDDVAAIHAPALGCPTCHGAGKTPTLDCASAACHPDGPPATHDSHPVTVTSGTVPILGVDYAGIDCTQCHTPFELQTIHGGSLSCGTCHPSPRDSFETWGSGCVQGGCHTPTSSLPIHSGIDGMHTAAAGDAAACGGAGCHGTISSVAALHAAGPGCAACHGAGKSPTVVCSTVGCHATGGGAHASHDSTVTAGTMVINLVDYGTHNCSECHASLELQTIHGGATSCGTCHPSPANTAADGSFACAQGDCHAGASTLPMHGGIDTAHTLVSAPDCTVGGCHSGGSDVAAIHAPALGCATCHGGGKTPTLVCASAGCHQTTTGAHASHVSTVTAGTITIGAVTYGPYSCSTCHASLELQTIHGGTTSCGKCHPTPANTAADGSFACAQGSCHTATSGNMETMHAEAAAGHTVSASGCSEAGCHTTNVAVIHNGSASKCAACHAGGRPPLTTDCSVCHDLPHAASHQWCSGCHADLPALTYDVHGADPQPDQACANCHGAPFQALDGTAWVRTSEHLGGCSYLNCHNQKELGGAGGDLHSVDRTADSCAGSACHPASLSNLTTIHTGGCVTCHAETAAQPVKDAIAAGTKACLSCHVSGMPVTHNSHPTTDITSTYTTSAYSVDLACSACHGTMDLQVRHGGASSCTKCHPSPANTANPGTNYACAQTGCHLVASGNMQVKHASMDADHALTAVGCNRSGCHAADLAAVHTTTKCAACHAPSKTPPKDCMSASCHGAGLDHYSSHAACNSCHDDAWDSGYGHYVDWIGGGDCYACHGTGAVWYHPDPYGYCHCSDPRGYPYYIW